MYSNNVFISVVLTKWWVLAFRPGAGLCLAYQASLAAAMLLHDPASPPVLAAKPLSAVALTGPVLTPHLLRHAVHWLTGLGRGRDGCGGSGKVN